MFVRLNLFLFTAALASSLSLDFAAAQPYLYQGGDYTEFGHITSLETGRQDDTMGVSLDVPFVNPRPSIATFPAGSICKTTNAGYALDPKDPGVKVHEAVLLSAFLAGRKVRLFLLGCIYDKPRIIAVGVGEPLH